MSPIDNRLSIHHVGGRAGTAPFAVPAFFGKDVVNVLYDADVDCIDHIRQSHPLPECELHVLPYCLGEACGRATFNLNYDPYTSSTKEPNPAYASYYLVSKGADYILRDTWKTMEKRSVDMVTLDHLFGANAVAAPPPDLLSVDTQGSDYEILLGAGQTLSNRVVALIVESEFHPLYTGQKLFGDIANWLADRGFVFVRFQDFTPELTPYRSAVGLRGQGFQTSADALFFRRIDTLTTGDDPIQAWLKLGKLAFVAMLLNQFEYGFEALRRREEILPAGTAGAPAEDRLYLKFLRELRAAAQRMPAQFPPTWSSKISFDQSQARFRAASDAGPGRDKAAGLAGRKGKWWSKMKRSFHKRLALFGLGPASGETPHSEVELLLQQYSLSEQANLMRTMRLNQARFCVPHG